MKRLGPLWVVRRLNPGLLVPRFHFHIRHEPTGTVDMDGEGLDLPDIAAAKAEALQAAKELVIERIRAGGRIDCGFEVTDAKGNLVFVLPFRDVIRF
jgi:hypothetical protein